MKKKNSTVSLLKLALLAEYSGGNGIFHDFRGSSGYFERRYIP